MKHDVLTSMTAHDSNTVNVPAGTYFLGDPCYAVPGELWDELLQSCDFFNAPVGRVQSHEVLGFATAFGDGTYVGGDGFRYWVDSGLIGLTPMALVPAHERERLSTQGRLIEFTTPALCSCRAGVMNFGQVRIDTRFFRDAEPAQPEPVESAMAAHLRDYLRGYGRSNLVALEHLATFARWQEVAAQELQARASSLIKAFSSEELQAVALGSVDMAGIAREVLSELKGGAR